MKRIIVPMLLAAASGTNAHPAPMPSGGEIDVERYAVSIRPDFATAAISGTETIVLRATSDRVTRLVFSPNALRISEATVDGAAAPVSSSKSSIVFHLPRALRKGSRATLRFRIDGTPARGVTTVPGGMYTGYFACDWMVCTQDAPGDKAHLALDLFLPAGVESVGVGRATPAAVSSDGLVLHRWRSTRPYSPYLYAFAAGSFSRRSVKTAEGEFLYLDATGTKADLAEPFASTTAMAAFFADKAGMPLPDRPYVQLLVPGRDAQEAASFSLIGAGELDRERANPSSAWIIAHELAHQWWGNLVTCATWRDFWLNEGIATFMVAAWREYEQGPAAYAREPDIARRRVERVREQGFDKPLAWSGKYPSLGARRAVQYSKGAPFLAHLRVATGDRAFWDGLRRFNRRHAGGTVTSEDSQNAMERASGRDLSPMFTEWVYGE